MLCCVIYCSYYHRSQWKAEWKKDRSELDRLEDSGRPLFLQLNSQASMNRILFIVAVFNFLWIHCALINVLSFTCLYVQCCFEISYSQKSLVVSPKCEKSWKIKQRFFEARVFKSRKFNSVVFWKSLFIEFLDSVY